jgi:hypothetical protein
VKRCHHTLPLLLILKFVAARAESRLSQEGRALARPDQSFLLSALQAAEKVLSFVGRTFRHDIKSMFSSGVLTPEGVNAHFSAAALAAEAQLGWGSAELRTSIIRFE